MRVTIPGVAFIDDLQREKPLMQFVSRNIVRAGLLPSIVQGGASALCNSSLMRPFNMIERRALREAMVAFTTGKFAPFEQPSGLGIYYTTCTYYEHLHAENTSASATSQAHAFQAEVITHEFL